MKTAKLSVPEIAAIGATRGMLGAGLGLLLADSMHKDTRRTLGIGLLTVGAVTTVPILLNLYRKMHQQHKPAPLPASWDEFEVNSVTALGAFTLM